MITGATQINTASISEKPERIRRNNPTSASPAITTADAFPARYARTIPASGFDEICEKGVVVAFEKGLGSCRRYVLVDRYACAEIIHATRMIIIKSNRSRRISRRNTA